MVAKSVLLEKKAVEVVQNGGSVPQLAEGEASSHIKFQFPVSKDSTLAKADQRLLCRITANSSSMVEMLTRYSEAEMSRTRNLDRLVEDAESRTNSKSASIDEIADLIVKLQRIRQEYDAKLVEDFHVLIDLAQSVESLESELGRRGKEPRRQKSIRTKESRSVVVPIQDSTIQLHNEVNALSEEVGRLEVEYIRELDKTTKELAQAKGRKIQNKSSFQQSLKSVFKDLEILAERLERGESTLEKINVHYQIGEDEIISIVSPILETIDGVKERIQCLHADADNYFYGNDSADIHNSS